MTLAKSVGEMIVLQNFINGDFVDTKSVSEDKVIDRYKLLLFYEINY